MRNVHGRYTRRLMALGGHFYGYLPKSELEPLPNWVIEIYLVVILIREKTCLSNFHVWTLFQQFLLILKAQGQQLSASSFSLVSKTYLHWNTSRCGRWATTHCKSNEERFTQVKERFLSDCETRVHKESRRRRAEHGWDPLSSVNETREGRRLVISNVSGLTWLSEPGSIIVTYYVAPKQHTRSWNKPRNYNKQNTFVTIIYDNITRQPFALIYCNSSNLKWPTQHYSNVSFQGKCLKCCVQELFWVNTCNYTPTYCIVFAQP